MSEIAELSIDIVAHDHVSAMLARVEHGLDRTDKSAQKAGRGIGQGVGDGTQKAAAGTLALQTAQARLESQQGNLAASAQRLRAALAAQTSTTTQTIAAQRQLLTVEDALAGKQSSLASGIQSLGGAIGGLPGQLLSVGTGIGAVTAAAGAGVAIVKSFGDAFVFQTQLDATTASINAQLKGVRDTGAVFAEAEVFANRYKLTQQETNNILQNSIGVLRTSTASVTELETTLLRLQSRDPSKPISEAARALRELNAGDVTTIKELFNIGAADALRMKNEIAGGADAVQVLSTFLDGAGNGMEVLENRTLGAVGAMNDLAVAQENVTKAQAAIATSAGGVTAVQLYAQAWQGLANLLNGDVTTGYKAWAIHMVAVRAANEAGTAAVSAGRTQTEAAALAQQVYNDVLTQAAQAEGLAGAATETHTKQVIAHISAEQAAAQALAATATALADDISKKQDADAATQKLAAVQKTLADLGPAVAGGLQSAASAAAFLATRYGFAYSEALKLVSAQAALAGAAAKVPMAGITEDRLSRDTQADRAQVKSNQALEANRALLVKINSEQKKAAGGGGGAKLSDQAKLNNSLLASQESFAQKSEQAESAHWDRVLDIQADFAEKAKQAQDDFAQSQLEGRAGFYDTLGSIEDAGLRQALSAQYEAAFQEADQIAREKGADVGAAFLDAKQAAIAAQGQRASEIAEATKAGDKDKAAYLAGVDALYRDAEERKLNAIKAGEGSIASARDAALAEESVKYDAAQTKIGDSADQAAARKVLAAERAGQAVDAELLKINALGVAYDRVGASGARAGIGPAPAPVGTTSAPAPAAASAPGDVVAALSAAQAAIVAALGSVVSAERDTAGAVRNLGPRFQS